MNNQEQLAQAILLTAIGQGMGATTAGRSMGLAALSHDARVAAQVLLGLVQIEDHTPPRPAESPKIGRPRKIRIYSEDELAAKNSISSSENTGIKE